MSWRATRRCGWHTLECDGLDAGKVERAIDEAIADARPSLIRCKTIIGYGAPNKQGTAATHGAALGEDEVAAARKELGLGPAAVRDSRRCRQAWREVGAARRRRARRMAPAARGQRQEGRVPRPHGGQARRQLAQALPRRAARRSAQGRHPQGVGNGARGDQRGDPGDDRRLGRPHRLQQHQDQGASSR